ncbi:Cleavage stimulation factor subunit 2 [Parelaphostrongylus tenuis]|uniref:Cleavage stimulation factor subunit 2 n=1 Tax=Parelaphostrongylus tenuis TaxID=148309 RepID=A0AAD5R738_PARTN|nr:Cleavage stimulation factor subunit 2 [Parelaphostrongylus tenuis]
MFFKHSVRFHGRFLVYFEQSHFSEIGVMQVDRSQRSVFVGNISYEVPEDTIRQIFSKVGHVVHIKMVHDRETGKPKGYGFIEFLDVQTAELAIRNLNGYEVNGRQLRVDSAAGGDRSVDEIQQLQAALSAAQVEESPYGPEPEEGRAPEAISRTVASLPPEKMFELMKQMKDVVRSNPSEAKQMLIQNPQLAYALLQAQVVMRIVDPQVAIAMLHREPAASTVPFHQVSFPAQPTPSVAAVPQPGYGVPQQMYGRPPTSQPQPPPQPDITPDEQHNAELLVQVMRLTEAEIAMLPPGDREKVIELRNQLRQSV